MAADGPGAFQWGHVNTYRRSENKYNLPMGERQVLFALRPGEGMLYPGCSVPHWRDVFLGEHCGQAFFHYAPAVADTFGAYFGDTERRQTAS